MDDLDINVVAEFYEVEPDDVTGSMLRSYVDDRREQLAEQRAGL